MSILQISDLRKKPSSRLRKPANVIRGLLLGAVMAGTLTVVHAQVVDTAVKPESQSLDLSITPVTRSQPVIQDYIISPDDDLDIVVMDVAQLSRQYRVSPRGTIDVPLLTEAVDAAGKSPEQLARVLGERLQKAGMVDHPQVTVRVKESRLHSVAIAGAVKKPQIYPVFGKTTLLDAISQSEGLALDAGNTAIVTRGELGLRMAGSDDADGVKRSDSRMVTVDLKRLLENGDPSQNLDLYPGDRVAVQRAGIVYVVGAVNRAGGFVLNNDREQMTVLKAIAMANNITAAAASKSAVIIRDGAKGAGGSQEIPVELDKILKHHAKDRVLLANDILFVPESGRKKAMMRASEAAAQAAVVMVYRF